MPVTTYEGFGCSAVLDTEAGTVTLAHHDVTTAKHKKESSPWVIPLGAITDVEFREKNALVRGWVRFILVDRIGYATAEIEDVNAFMTGKHKIGPFIDAINQERPRFPPSRPLTMPKPSMSQRMKSRTEEFEAHGDELREQREAIKQEARVLRPDIQAAKDRMQGTIGTGREFKNLETHLWEGETVEMTCGGTYGRGQGLLVLTNTRLLFTFSGVMSQTTEDFPLDKISSIQWSAGMLMGTVTIFASGNKAEIKNVGKQDGKAVVDRVRGLISGQTVSAPIRSSSAPVGSTAPAPPPPPSVPAGWYPDSADAVLLRYWDGEQWTEHTAPRPPQ